MTNVYEYTAKRLNGEQEALTTYQNKVLLIVNTASHCGFTPQFEGLQKLYEQFKSQGFEILGFPCDQFLHQEPGNSTQIAEFCQLNYGVTFPMFEKIEVNGNQTHPLYVHLKKTAPGLMGSQSIKWNFTKFLVNREGHVKKRYATAVTPEQLTRDIIRALD